MKRHFVACATAEHLRDEVRTLLQASFSTSEELQLCVLGFEGAIYWVFVTPTLEAAHVHGGRAFDSVRFRGPVPKEVREYLQFLQRPAT